MENKDAKLAGLTAIVTGAGSSGPGFGTGKAISVLLAREGAKIALVDMFEERANETLQLIKDEGGEAAVITADLSETSSYRRIVDETVARFGGVDILVNNAAVSSSTGILDTSQELYDKIIAVNLTAPFMLTKAVIPLMAERGGGAIVNITSITALRGQGGKGTAAYSASKAALAGMMVDVADAHGSSGIRINCVAPGIVKTPMQRASIIQAGFDPDKIDLSDRTSLGIEGDAWDIARAVLFLAGPDGRYITGVHIPVDGGVTARCR